VLGRADHSGRYASELSIADATLLTGISIARVFND